MGRKKKENARFIDHYTIKEAGKLLRNSFQNENYFVILWLVNIIAKGTLLYYIDKYPKAKTALLTWYYEFTKTAFSNFNELKQVYGNASILQNSRVIFNIKGNDFRLLVAVNFRKQAAYIIWFGTHREYDKINAETINFDTGILNYKQNEQLESNKNKSRI